MNSKWFYVCVGVCILGAVIGAVSGIFWFMIVEALLGMWNWFLGEKHRDEENALLIAEYVASKQSNLEE